MLERHELSSTIVVTVVALVCTLPLLSVDFIVDAITDGTELHDFEGFFDGFTVDFFVVCGVVDTHELAGTTVVFFVELVCLRPFESVEITSVSITDVIELHDFEGFFDGFTIDLFVVCGVVDTHELAGTTVVFFVELVCLRPFESVEITSVSITDVIELHDLLGFGDVVERHELSSTIVVTVVALVCTLPLLSVDFIVDAITDGTVRHDFLGLGFVVGTLGVVLERHELSSTIVVTVVALVCTLPLLSVDFIVDAITDGTELHDLLGFGDVVERHELSSTIVVTVVALVCTLPLLSVDFIVDAITDGTELHDLLGFGDDVQDLFGTVMNDRLVRTLVKLPFESVSMYFWVNVRVLLTQESRVVAVVSPRSGAGLDGELGDGPVEFVTSLRSPLGLDGERVLDVHERFGFTVVDDVTRVVRSPFEFVVVFVTGYTDVSDSHELVLGAGRGDGPVEFVTSPRSPPGLVGELGDGPVEPVWSPRPPPGLVGELGDGPVDPVWSPRPPPGLVGELGDGPVEPVWSPRPPLGLVGELGDGPIEPVASPRSPPGLDGCPFGDGPTGWLLPPLSGRLLPPLSGPLL